MCTIHHNDTSCPNGLNPQSEPLAFTTCMCADMQFSEAKYEESSLVLGSQAMLMYLQISTESVELEELREMKADVERREKAQASVLERQAKRLDELETLYKV